VRRAPDGGAGWIEVIAGSMFSGKSEELIRRLRRARIAKRRVQVFTPRIDRRTAEDEVVSHSAWRIPAERVASAREIRERLDPDTEVVGIDEVQFFDPEIVGLVQELADRGVRVVVAGLDQDYRGVPFEPVPQLMALAEEVTKTLAVCARCGAPANRTQRLGGSEERILIGAENLYEARCRRCHEPPAPQPELELASAPAPAGGRRENAPREGTTP
jgi:thymidine kinase